MDLRLEDLDMPGAVHRLYPEPLRALIQKERAVHVLAVLLEMPRALVDLFVRDVRRVHERVRARDGSSATRSRAPRARSIGSAARAQDPNRAPRQCGRAQAPSRARGGRAARSPGVA